MVEARWCTIHWVCHRLLPTTPPSYGASSETEVIRSTFCRKVETANLRWTIPFRKTNVLFPNSKTLLFLCRLLWTVFIGPEFGNAPFSQKCLDPSLPHWLWLAVRYHRFYINTAPVAEPNQDSDSEYFTSIQFVYRLPCRPLSLDNIKVFVWKRRRFSVTFEMLLKLRLSGWWRWKENGTTVERTFGLRFRRSFTLTNHFLCCRICCELRAILLQSMLLAGHIWNYTQLIVGYDKVQDAGSSWCCSASCHSCSHRDVALSQEYTLRSMQ